MMNVQLILLQIKGEEYMSEIIKIDDYRVKTVLEIALEAVSNQ